MFVLKIHRNNVTLTGSVHGSRPSRCIIGNFAAVRRSIMNECLLNYRIFPCSRGLVSVVRDVGIGALFVDPLIASRFLRVRSVVSGLATTNVGVVVVPGTR